MTKEALKMALEALEPLVRRAAPLGELDWLNGCKAITAIKEALAQPKQEPVVVDGGYIETTARWGKHFVEILDPTKKNEILRVYFEQPQQRQWVGLTELEKAEITNLKWWDWEDTFDLDGFIKAIEAKLKEKNNAT